jgi:hypothetical protein
MVVEGSHIFLTTFLDFKGSRCRKDLTQNGFRHNRSDECWRVGSPKDDQTQQIASSQNHSPCVAERQRVTLLQIDLSLTARLFFAYVREMANCLIDAFVVYHVSEKAANALSIAPLVLHHTICNIDTVAPVIRAILPDSVHTAALAVDWDLCYRVLVHGIFPAAFCICICAFIAAVLLPKNPTEASMLSRLLGILLVECLASLTCAVCVGLYILGTMSGPDAIAITVLVRFLGCSCAQLIRTVFNPTLGTGLSDDRAPL